MRKVTLIPGDGTGPELTRAARRVLDASGAAIEWEEVDAGEPAFARFGDALPEDTVASVHRTGVALKGPISVPLQGYPSPNAALLKETRSYAQVRLAISFPGARAGRPGTSLVIVRDITESLGRGPQDWLGENAGYAMKVITRGAVERVARFTFEYARRHGLRKVMMPLQARTHRTTDGLFQRVATEVAAGFPELEVSTEAMDSAAMRLVMRPQDFQVILCETSFGGIAAGLCSGLIGSVGLMPGGNFGPEVAVFEAGHGSAPHYAGMNKVNPTGVILSGAMMLEHIGDTAAANRVWGAVRAVIEEGRSVTYDLGGTAGTSEMADAIIAHLTSVSGD